MGQETSSGRRSRGGGKLFGVVAIAQNNSRTNTRSFLGRRGQSHRMGIGLLFALALTLFVVARFFPVWQQDVRTSLTDGLAPLLSLVARPAHIYINYSENFSEYWHAYDAIDELRARNEFLENAMLERDLLRYENEALKTLVGRQDKAVAPDGKQIVARVIGSGGHFHSSFIVDMGADQGVFEGMAALDHKGLIGRVIDVGQNSSRVLLISDSSSRLAARPLNWQPTDDSRQSAPSFIVTGNHAPHLNIKYLPERAGLVPGMKIVTSGAGGQLPTGILIGTLQINSSALANLTRVGQDSDSNSDANSSSPTGLSYGESRSGYNEQYIIVPAGNIDSPDFIKLVDYSQMLKAD